jgi:hypothetical protein
MESAVRISTIVAMHPKCVGSAILAVSLLCFAPEARAQYLFNLTLRGTAYYVDSSGKMVTNAITDQSILRDLAAAVGADYSTWKLAYHISGSSFGDTIDVIDTRNGNALDTVFGFYFGDSLGRYAMTNTTQTEVRRVDYIYTKQSRFALGSAFLTKRFTPDTSGNVRTTIDAEMHWLVRPDGNNPAKTCTALFTTTTPLKLP